MNRKKAIDVKNAIEAIAIKKAEEFGLVIDGRSSTRYGLSDVSIKLNFVEKSEDGTAETSLEKDFKLYAEEAGLDPNMLGKTFISHNGEKVQLMGYNSRARKTPIIYTQLSNGRNYRTTEAAAKTWKEVS